MFPKIFFENHTYKSYILRYTHRNRCMNVKALSFPYSLLKKQNPSHANKTKQNRNEVQWKVHKTRREKI